MDNLSELDITILAGIVGFLAGFVFEIVLEGSVRANIPQQSLRRFRIGRRIVFGVSGALIGTALELVLEMNRHVEEMQKTVANIPRYEAYSEAQASIATIDHQPSRDAFANQLVRIDAQLKRLVHGNAVIQGSDVLEVWEELITSAEHCVVASNLVLGTVFKKAGTVAERGQHQLPTFRVFLQDADECGKQDLRELIKKQKDNGILVKERTKKLIENTNLLRTLTSELGTSDLVLVDGQILLKTYVKNCKIQHSEITVVGDDLANAGRFFEKLIEEVDVLLPATFSPCLKYDPKAM